MHPNVEKFSATNRSKMKGIGSNSYKASSVIKVRYKHPEKSIKRTLQKDCIITLISKVKKNQHIFKSVKHFCILKI